MIRKHTTLVSFLLLLALGCIAWVHRSSFISLVQKWESDAAFSHGYLILPITLWLIWRQRDKVRAVEWHGSYVGLVLLMFATTVWVAARGAGVLVVEQLAVVGMIPATVLAILGWRATSILVFPLFFLFFAVPFGRGVVPLLMEAAADVATWALDATGVPVHRSHMYISIPEGSFEVARACSGLNYFITGLVLGTLYAYLTYSGWKKRLLCMVAFVVIPVVANGVRVYFTILISHWTDMRFGPGHEHVIFGRVFFVVVVLAMFWVGRRWADDKSSDKPSSSSPSAVAWGTRYNWLPVALVFGTVFAGPLLFESSVTQARARLSDAAGLVSLPESSGSWRGPKSGEGLWRPQYEGGLWERQARYEQANGAGVDVFVALYGLGVTQGTEMISFQNVIAPEERRSLAETRRLSLVLPSGSSVDAREMQVRDSMGMRLVWFWFVIGKHATDSEYKVKAYEAMAIFTRDSDSERIITLSTPLDDGARGRLQSFFEEFGECAASGFAAEACGG